MISNVLFWLLTQIGRLNSGIHLSSNAIIGPYSRIRIKNGGVMSSRYRFRAKDGLRVNIDGGVLKFRGKFFANSNCSINVMSQVEIGGGCIFGEGVKIYDHDHEFIKGTGWNDTHYNSKPVSVGDKVWIGSNVIILKGVSIGNNSVIGAGAVLTKSVPANTVLLAKQNQEFVSLDKSSCFVDFD